MKKINSIILALVVALSVSLIPKNKVYACTCAPEDENTRVYIETAYKTSDVIFSGRVVKLTEIGYSDIKAQPLVRATIEVYEIWKGPPYRHFIVQTDICDYPFQYGEEYLFFAYGNAGNLYAGMFCNPTTELREADNYIKILGDGILPISENPNINQEDLEQAPSSENINTFILIIGICITVLALGIRLLTWISKPDQY